MKFICPYCGSFTRDIRGNVVHNPYCYRLLATLVVSPLEAENAALRKRNQELHDALHDYDPVYCPVCGACGEPGCCPPNKCLYVETYQGDYDSLCKENAALRRKVERLGGAIATALDLLKHSRRKDSATETAMVYQAEDTLQAAIEEAQE